VDAESLLGATESLTRGFSHRDCEKLNGNYSKRS
jgi:hypothetical protein